MPRVASEMSALDVKRLEHPGTGRNVTVAVGGVTGLLLQITPNGAKSWILRTTIGQKRREIGLGGYPDVTLADARERARLEKYSIRQGIDPIEERKSRKAELILAQRRGLLFADAVERCLSSKLDEFKNHKHRQQWQNTLQTYAIPELGPMLVQDIEVQDVLRVLQPIWIEKTETASRLRGRIEAVLSWATVSGHRSGDNPARWANNLKELLPTPSKVTNVENQPALQIDDVNRWIAAAKNREGLSYRAIVFAALTVARSQEIRGAAWSEIDIGKGLWTVPANRMKMDREHRIPLSTQAIELLRHLPRGNETDLVFPGAKGGKMSDMTLNKTMKRLHEADIANGGPGFSDRLSNRPAVPHGLRSTFRDWVAERTRYPGDMAEIALAHKVSNSVEAAYRRGDMVEKRRSMMQDWSDFAMGQQDLGQVIEFR